MVHIDIETDDVEAEVTRLEKLGARKREKVKGWWVMVAPGDHPFCVVPVQRSDRMGVIQRAPNQSLRLGNSAGNFKTFTRITYCLSST